LEAIETEQASSSQGSTFIMSQSQSQSSQDTVAQFQPQWWEWRKVHPVHEGPTVRVPGLCEGTSDFYCVKITGGGDQGPVVAAAGLCGACKAFHSRVVKALKAKNCNVPVMKAKFEKAHKFRPGGWERMINGKVVTPEPFAGWTALFDEFQYTTLECSVCKRDMVHAVEGGRCQNCSKGNLKTRSSGVQGPAPYSRASVNDFPVCSGVADVAIALLCRQSAPTAKKVHPWSVLRQDALKAAGAFGENKLVLGQFLGRGAFKSTIMGKTADSESNPLAYIPHIVNDLDLSASCPVILAMIHPSSFGGTPHYIEEYLQYILHTDMDKKRQWFLWCAGYRRSTVGILPSPLLVPFNDMLGHIQSRVVGMCGVDDCSSCQFLSCCKDALDWRQDAGPLQHRGSMLRVVVEEEVEEEEEEENPAGIS
jgi:hypothetical protein